MFNQANKCTCFLCVRLLELSNVLTILLFICSFGSLGTSFKLIRFLLLTCLPFKYFSNSSTLENFCGSIPGGRTLTSERTMLYFFVIIQVLISLSYLLRYLNHQQKQG